MGEITACVGYPFSWSWASLPGETATMSIVRSIDSPLYSAPRLPASTHNHLFWCPRCEIAMLEHWRIDTRTGTPLCDSHQEWCTHTNEPEWMRYLGDVGRDRIAATKSDARVWK